MVGDWVRHINGTPYQVTCIKDGHFACGIPHLWEYNNKFEPILLTAKILEKNGFMRFSTSYLLEGKHFVLGNPSNPKQYMDNYWLRVSNRDIHIEYVHELQHALRLCGIEKTIEL